MDSVNENCKQLHPEHEQILGAQYDWLSNLPTDILHHILSNLDNTEVVKTGLLSRRWRYIWVSVPCMNFNFRCFLNKHFQIYGYNACLSKFWKLVEDNLIIRDPCPTYKLRFICDGYGEKQFKLLLSFCDMRNVEELILLAGYDSQHCPCCTDPGSPIKQNFNGLVSLQRSLRVFDRLKTLHLVKVQFPHPDITEKLFSDCGVLENLLMENCSFGDINILNISAHKLKYLRFVNEDHYRCNYKHGFTCPGCDTVIIVESVCPGKPCGEFNCLRFLKLDAGWHEDYVEGLINILKITPNLEALSLNLSPCHYSRPNEMEVWESRDVDVPCLSNRLQTVEISDYYDVSYLLELIKIFLKNGKCLEKMTIVQKKPMSPMRAYELHLIPLASEAVSVDVYTVFDTGMTQLCQFVYEKCETSARNQKKFLRLKPIRRSVSVVFHRPPCPTALFS